MSNNDTELFDLCKAVYEATGWDDNGADLMDTFKDGTPIYDSDYLLEKLPLGENINAYFHRTDGGLWLFQWTGRNISGIGNTPVKALLSLTLTLHKQERI